MSLYTHRGGTELLTGGTENKITDRGGTENRITNRSGTENRITDRGGTENRITNRSGTENKIIDGVEQKKELLIGVEWKKELLVGVEQQQTRSSFLHNISSHLLKIGKWKSQKRDHRRCHFWENICTLSPLWGQPAPSVWLPFNACIYISTFNSLLHNLHN